MKDLKTHIKDYFCVQTDHIDGPIADAGQSIIRSGTEKEMSEVFNQAIIDADFPYIFYGRVLKKAESEYTVREL